MSKVAKTGNRRLDQLEHDIEHGIRSIGKSLMEIRDSRIYMEDYESFEAYCKERWGFTDRHARNLIDAEKVRAKIATLVPVETLRESHLIELSKLPERQQAQVAAAVIEKCESEQREPTAKDFRQAVASESPTQSGTIVPVKTQETQGKQQKTALDPDVWEDVEDEPEVTPSKPLPKTVMSQSPQELLANIHAVGETLLALIKEVNRLADQVGGEWIDCQEVETRAKSLRTLIRGFAYWVDCPKCKGKRCNDCKRIGWLSVDRKQFLSQEMKDLLEVN